MTIQVHATDPDSPGHPHGTLTYSIVPSAGSGNFTINSATGVIKTSHLLDYDTQTEHQLTVRATEQSGQNYVDGSMIIKLNNINDNIPVCAVQNFRYATRKAFLPVINFISLQNLRSAQPMDILVKHIAIFYYSYIIMLLFFSSPK